MFYLSLFEGHNTNRLKITTGEEIMTRKMNFSLIFFLLLKNQTKMWKMEDLEKKCEFCSENTLYLGTLSYFVKSLRDTKQTRIDNNFFYLHDITWNHHFHLFLISNYLSFIVGISVFNLKKLYGIPYRRYHSTQCTDETIVCWKQSAQRLYRSNRSK